jgi:hypothetical protein
LTVYGEGEEGEDLLGMLEEADAAQFVVGDELGGDACRSLPVGGSENSLWTVALEEVAHDFRPLGHEDALATAILLLFELSDVFELVFTDHFQKSR